MNDENYLAHVGRSKRNGAPGPGSGRYPLGSGEEPYQDYPKDQLKKMAKSKDSNATKKELAAKVNKSKAMAKAKATKKNDKSLSEIARKRAEEFRKSRYKKKIEKEKAEAKRYKEQIRLEKTRLDKEKAKEEAKRLKKMTSKDYNGDAATAEELKKVKEEEKNYSIKPKPVNEMSNQEIQNYLNRVRLEKDYNSIVNAKHKSAGRKMVEQMLLTQGQRLGNQLLTELSKQFVDSVHEQMHKNDTKKKYGPSKKPIDEMNNNELKDFITRSSLESQVNKYREEEKKKKNKK